MREPRIKKVLKKDISPYFKKDISPFFKKEIKLRRKPKKKSIVRKKQIKKSQNNVLIILVVIFLICGFLWGTFYGQTLFNKAKAGLLKIGVLGVSEEIIERVLPFIEETEYNAPFREEQDIIDIVKKASPAVVSIVVTKEMPVYEDYLEKKYEDLMGGYRLEYDVPGQRQNGTEVKKIGGGTGFFVSKDGLVLTNKHVIADDEADFTVITNDGKQHSAVLVDKDPFQDLAVLKVKSDDATEVVEFPVLKLGNSEIIMPGQTVIAIGNALGEFSNTVSVGIVSGLSRNITATGSGIREELEDLIQTDAAINKGNSGGPLLNSRGEVIGVNVAMAESAQSIGFAIPINKAKQDVASVKKFGEIRKPFLGVVYKLVNEELQEELDLSVDYGAWIVEE